MKHDDELKSGRSGIQLLHSSPLRHRCVGFHSVSLQNNTGYYGTQGVTSAEIETLLPLELEAAAYLKTGENTP